MGQLISDKAELKVSGTNGMKISQGDFTVTRLSASPFSAG